jgi:hypothetical protein
VKIPVLRAMLELSRGSNAPASADPHARRPEVA